MKLHRKQQHGWRKPLCFVLVLGLILAGSALGLQQAAAKTNDTTTKVGETHPNPLQDQTFYAETNTNAEQQAAKWRSSRPTDAVLMDKLAAQPSAKWIVTAQDLDEVEPYVRAAADKHAIPVLVAYNIPHRDCGLYSAGGASDEQRYKSYIDAYAKGIGDKPAVLILEPDALAQLQEASCLSTSQKQDRTALLRYAVDTFKKNPRTLVYIDAGNSSWIPDTRDVANRLKSAGILHADGFSLNVSNFLKNKETIEYGKKIAAKLDNAHFVVDTSRNGRGTYTNKQRPDFDWCNPPGRALGHYPTPQTDEPLVDAFLYIKSPGESDGADKDKLKCGGGPEAGVWWPEYALGLVKRWPSELQPKQ